MRRSVLTLTTVSLGLAASTAYLAYELRAARQELADFRGSAGDAARAAPAMTAATTENHTPAVQATPIAGMPASTKDPARPGEPSGAQHGAQYTGLNNEYGSLFYSSTAQDVDQRVEEASEFQRRQRERAAQVLSSQQLQLFTERQAEGLEQARRSWEFEQRSEGRQ